MASARICAEALEIVAPDSIKVVARYMLEHPEGLMPNEFNFQELISQCHEFEEVTGEAGDFVIMHPYMLHASSQNVIRQPRWMTNPPKPDADAVYAARIMLDLSQVTPHVSGPDTVQIMSSLAEIEKQKIAIQK